MITVRRTFVSTGKATLKKVINNPEGLCKKKEAVHLLGMDRNCFAIGLFTILAVVDSE